MSNRLQIITRSNDSTTLVNGPPEIGSTQDLPCGPTHIIELSKDGSMVCAVTSNSFSVIETKSLTQTILSINIKEVLFATFSPLATYVITCVRPNRELKAQHKNVQVWKVSSGECVWEIHNSRPNSENWPFIQWNDDESLAFISVTNNVHIYSPSDNFSGIIKKLPLKGLGGFSVSSGINVKIAAYVPEGKGAPASVKIFSYDSLPTDQQGVAEAINSKAFFRVSGIKLYWNSIGSALLCLCYSDVDVTNQSYYGEQHLNYLDGSEVISCQVPNTPKGPIHDVQWSPNGNYFVVIAGFMPASALLFNSKCKPLFYLGSGAYNYIRWSLFSRFLCIAGFGNLPGDIVFFEKKSNDTCVKIGSTRSPSVTLDWAPNGRHVLTAITAPRLRVDNGYKIFNYVGEELYKTEVGELYEALWIPQPKGAFEDRPISPHRLSKNGTVSNIASGNNSTKAAYVPPRLRGKTGEAKRSNAPSFSLAQGGIKGGKIVKPEPEPDVPGGFFVETGKKPKQKKASVQKEQGESSQIKKEVEKDMANANSTDKKVTDASACEIDNEKKIRALKKKLRQIDALKEKIATGGRNSLSKEQSEKVNMESSIKKELKDLEQ